MPRPTRAAFRAFAWLSLGLVLWAAFPHGHPAAHSLRAGDSVSADDHHQEHSSQPLVESHPCSICRSAEHHPCDRPSAQAFATAKAPTRPADRRDPDLRVRIFAARHPARGPPTEAQA